MMLDSIRNLQAHSLPLRTGAMIPNKAPFASAASTPLVPVSPQQAKAHFLGGHPAIRFAGDEDAKPTAKKAEIVPFPPEELANLQLERLEKPFRRFLDRLYTKHTQENKLPIALEDFIVGLLEDPVTAPQTDAIFLRDLMAPPKKALNFFKQNPELRTMGLDDKLPPGKVLDTAVEKMLNTVNGIVMKNHENAIAAYQAPANSPPPPVTLRDVMQYWFDDSQPEEWRLDHLATKSLKKMSYRRMQDDTILPSVLDQYSKDLGLMFEAGRLDPVIGRDQELLDVITILTKKKKRNPILVGEAGVGKTAVVEKLAERLVKKQVPAELIRQDGRGAFLKELDMSAIEALGQEAAPKVLDALIKEAEERNGELILFMDEAHRMNPEVNVNSTLLNMWKPPLARGAFPLIGATTLDEHRKFIEKDSALDRRFKPVRVEEPSLPDTMVILRGLREHLEEHHGVVIRDDALEAAVFKANRFKAGKQMPDVAIDVIDEATAMVKNQAKGVSYGQLLREGTLYKETINEKQGLEKREKEFDADMEILQDKLTEAKEALNKTLTADSKAKVSPQDLESFVGSVASRQLQPFATHAPLDKAQERIQQMVDCNAKPQLEAVVKASRAVYLKDMDLTETRKDLDAVRARIAELREQLAEKQVLPVVNVQDVLTIISQNFGVPVSKLSEDETDKLRRMKDEIRHRVIGQEAAVDAVVAEIQKSKLGIGKGDKPIGSFLFMGPTGVGKTELAKAVAEYLFDDEKSMIRVDMSELQEEHSVSKLIGSPPGYVGYDDGGNLVEKVRKKPYSVVLLDEIDKAHPKIYDLLLQILDDGRLTDSKGRTVDFKNTVVIMTSNKGTREIMDSFKNVGSGIDPNSRLFKRMHENLRLSAEKAISEGTSGEIPFKPEFRNRLGESVIVFHPLVQAHIREILPIQIRSLNKELSQSEHKIQVSFDDEAMTYLAEIGTDVMNGARPLKTKIEKIKNHISQELLEGRIAPGATLNVTRENLKDWAI
jgi:ATP-dependent Clp protease ATP-binding subunit ClpB